MAAIAGRELTEAMHRNHLLAGGRVANLGPSAACERVGPWECLDCGSSDFPVVNGAAVHAPAGVGDIPLAVDWFARRNLTPAFELRSDADHALVVTLMERGFQQMLVIPEMVLTEPAVAPVGRGARPPGPPLVITEALSDQEVERYGRVNWPADSQYVGVAIARNARALGFRLLLGTLDGEAAACSMAVVSEGLVGIYNVAVEPEFRRRGFGEAMTRAAIDIGLDDGARMACLGSSDMGLPMYVRMGFQTQYSYLKLAAPA